MLGDISGVNHIYLITGFTDMRKSIDGLMAIIQDSAKLDPYSNSLFLFCGRRADRIKALHYEKDGFCLLYKRLDRVQEEKFRISLPVRVVKGVFHKRLADLASVHRNNDPFHDHRLPMMYSE